MNARCPDVLAPFLRPLEGVSAAGLEPTDEDFIAIVALVEKTAWDDLDERIRALDEDRMLDVRIFAFASYLAWRADGFAALPFVHEGLARVAGPELGAFGPARKKVAHLDVRAAWALTTIADDIVYHQKKRTPEWAGWTKSVTREVAERIAETRRAAQGALEAIGATRAADALGRVAGAVDTNVATLVRDDDASRPVAAGGASPAVSAVAEPAEDEAPPSYADEADVPPVRSSAGAAKLRARDIAPGGSVVSLAVAPAFAELVRKLEAFESLIAQGKYQKAALVADDLTEIISRFDPRVYFPDLFSSFGKALSENIEVLGEHWESRESLSWKALEQFYRVDLKRFVDG